jgi:hypothetical protein
MAFQQPGYGSPAAVATHKRGSRWALGCALLALVSLFLMFGVGALGAGAYYAYWYHPEWLGGGVREITLLERELEPNPRAVASVEVPGQARLELPPGVVTQRTKLRLSSVRGLTAPEDHDLGAVLGVELGEQHSFAQPLVLELPYDASRVRQRGVRGSGVIAVYWDDAAKRWSPVPYSIDPARNVVRVETDHLSIFSAVFAPAIVPSPTARVGQTPYPFAVQFADTKTAEELLRADEQAAAETGWGAAMEWFGIAQAAGTLGEEGASIAQLSKASAVLGKVNEIAGNLGVAFAFVQFALDMSKGDDEKREAVGNALKAYGMDLIGRFGTSAMKLSSVGLFALDYSLNKFGETAWRGRRDVYTRAYAAYYAEHPRSETDWLARFKTLASSGQTPEANSAALRGELELYAKEFWSDRSVVGEYQERLQGTAATGLGGLSDKLEDEISAAYVGKLVVELQPVFRKLEAAVAAEHQQRAQGLMDQLKARLNQTTSIEISVRSKDPTQPVKDLPVTFAVKRDPEKWRGTTDASGTLRFSVTGLGYLLYGSPSQVSVLVKGADGKPEERKAELKFTPGVTRVVIDLDSTGGTFAGELNGSYSGKGIDGTVSMKGPVQIVIDPTGRATMTFSMPLEFSSGRGAAKVRTNSTGKLTGQANGQELQLEGSVTTETSVTLNVPGLRGAPKVAPATRPARATVRFVSSDRLEGTVTGGPGSAPVPFTATRR